MGAGAGLLKLALGPRENAGGGEKKARVAAQVSSADGWAEASHTCAAASARHSRDGTLGRFVPEPGWNICDTLTNPRACSTQANFLGLGVLLFGAAVGVSWYNKRNGKDSMSHGHSHG